MEESDKATALKKAYAEIILNTAKESAARVMLSDRKSARFHHDLSDTKDEALRLLVRLKHMIDAKTIEAEVISSNQQREIDVLEAQLHEAEDIITDLRSEVRWVRDRLEKAKAFESQKLSLVNKEEEEETVSVHRVVVESLNPDQEDLISFDDIECENGENLEKAKASESQERNLVNMEEEMVSAHKVDQEVVLESLKPDQEVADTCFSLKMHEFECKNDEKHFNGFSIVDTSMGNDVCESESDGDIRIKKLELSRNGCTHRIHALERVVLESKPSSSADEEEQEGTTEKDSEENLTLADGDEEAGTLGNTRCLVLALRASSAELVTIPSNSLGIKKTSKSRRRKRRFGKPKATSVRSQSQIIKPCQSQSNITCTSNTSTSDGEDSIENMNQADYLVEASQESNLVSVNVEDAELPESEIKMMKPLPRLTSRKEDVLVSCEGEEEDSVVPSTKLASSLVNLHPESKVTATVSDQISESSRTNVNRLLKYTFQRKRKRGSSNSNEDSNNLRTI